MTDEQAQEMVAYLPMLRRIASYEEWIDASIPAAVAGVLHFLGDMGALFESGDHLGPNGSALPEALRRSGDEPLPERARLHWRQIEGVEDELDAAAEAQDDETFEAVRVRATAIAERNVAAARVP